MAIIIKNSSCLNFNPVARFSEQTAAAALKIFLQLVEDGSGPFWAALIDYLWTQSDVISFQGATALH